MPDIPQSAGACDHNDALDAMTMAGEVIAGSSPERHGQYVPPSHSTLSIVRRPNGDTELWLGNNMVIGSSERQCWNGWLIGHTSVAVGRLAPRSESTGHFVLNTPAKVALLAEAAKDDEVYDWTEEPPTPSVCKFMVALTIAQLASTGLHPANLDRQQAVLHDAAVVLGVFTLAARVGTGAGLDKLRRSGNPLDTRFQWKFPRPQSHLERIVWLETLCALCACAEANTPRTHTADHPGRRADDLPDGWEPPDPDDHRTHALPPDTVVTHVHTRDAASPAPGTPVIDTLERRPSQFSDSGGWADWRLTLVKERGVVKLRIGDTTVISTEATTHSDHYWRFDDVSRTLLDCIPDNGGSWVHVNLSDEQLNRVIRAAERSGYSLWESGIPSANRCRLMLALSMAYVGSVAVHPDVTVSTCGVLDRLARNFNTVAGLISDTGLGLPVRTRSVVPLPAAEYRFLAFSRCVLMLWFDQLLRAPQGSSRPPVSAASPENTVLPWEEL